MNVNNIETYYAALPITRDTKCTRLLQVYASTDTEGPGGPIFCDMSVHNLDAQPSFAALSYVWGTMSPSPATICCGSVDLPISTNGLSALRHLRAKLGAFTIWIDAVCINQLDAIEKAQQIPLMEQIYESATTTYFWLGEGGPAKQRAMNYLCQPGFIQYYFERPSMLWSGGVRRRTWAAYFHYYSCLCKFSPVFPDNVDCTTEGSNRVSHHDIDTLLDCSWTTRIWTFQEAVLAQNPVVVCGLSHIGWEQFTLQIILLSGAITSKCLQRWMEVVASRAIFQAEIKGGDISPKQLDDYCNFCVSISDAIPVLRLTCLLISSSVFLSCTMGLPFAPRFNSIITTVSFSLVLSIAMIVSGLFIIRCLWTPPDWTRSRIQNTKSLINDNLHDILSRTLATRRATNPKDMAFGLRSVLKHYSKKDTGGKTVQYSDPVEVIYRDIVVGMMGQTRSLNYLFLAAQKSYLNGPSWIPDFSHNLAGLDMTDAYKRYTYRPTKRSRAYIKVHPHDESTIIVKGFPSEEIAAVRKFFSTNIAYSGAEEQRHLDNVESLMIFCFPLLQRLYCRDELYVPTYRGLLQAAIWSGDPLMNVSEINYYLDKLIKHTSRHRILARLRPSIDVSTHALKFWKLVNEHRLFQRYDLLKIHIDVTNALARSGLRVLETTRGNIGYCMGKAEKCDMIYLISGLASPLVMRGDDSNLRIITTAHIATRSGHIKTWPEYQVTFYHGWTEKINELQENAHTTSDGAIPHPMKSPLWMSDPDNLLETLLPDVHIH